MLWCDVIDQGLLIPSTDFCSGGVVEMGDSADGSRLDMKRDQLGFTLLAEFFLTICDEAELE